MKLIDPTDKRIIGLHKSAQKNAAKAVREALQCGVLLIKKQASMDHGDWLPYLDRLGIARETARRYMICAERQAQIGGNFADCKSLMDLYRAYGLLPELAGGGARNGKDKDNGRASQLFFDFNLFGGFMRVIEHTKENPFINVDHAELCETRVRTVRALELMEQALERKPKGTK